MRLKMKLVVLSLLLSMGQAFAQSSPNLTYGQVPTPAQWNGFFMAKQDVLNYTPLNVAGGIMTGPLITAQSTTSAAGLNIPPGTAPTSPNNGDFWTTSAGAFIRINGATINLAGTTSASFAATAPVGVTFPGGVVTYALAFNSSLVNTAGSLGINLANSNIFTANQTINLNAAPLSTPTTSGVQLGGANSASVAYDVDAFAGQPQVTGRRANGTAASPTAVASGDVLLNANGNGYYGSGYNTSGGAFVVSAAQNYSSATTAGTQLDFYVTANSVGNIPSLVGRAQNDGGLTWPPTVTGGDKGAGTINAAGLYVNGTAVSSGGSVTSVTITAGNGIAVSGTCPSAITTTGTCAVAVDPSYVRDYIAGLTLSNDTGSANTVIDMAAGVATDSTNAVLIKVGAFTKSTGGAWASGSGSNGMGNGLTIANNTWYHVCLTPNGGTSDYWFDTSAVCANKPSGVSGTTFRRIGSFKTATGTTNIIAFLQIGQRFYWQTPVEDATNLSITTAPANVTLTVPLGVSVRPILNALANNATGGTARMRIYSPLLGDNNNANNANVGLSVGASGADAWSPISQEYTNTSSQLRVVEPASDGTVTTDIFTTGWTDDRGAFN